MKVAIKIDTAEPGEVYQRIWQLGIEIDSYQPNVGIVVAMLHEDLWDDVARINGVIGIAPYEDDE